MENPHPGSAVGLINGFTAAQIGAAAAKVGAAASAQVPGRASTAASLVSTTTAPFTVSAGGEQVVTASCASGSKAVGGGFANPTTALVLSAGSLPTSDGTGWTEDLVNERRYDRRGRSHRDLLEVGERRERRRTPPLPLDRYRNALPPTLGAVRDDLR